MLFSSSAQRWEILKKHVELSIKSQSDTRWESRIKCIKPLRYNLKEVLLALKDLEAISIERKDGRAASETKSLIAHLSKWSFLLSVFIWYDILFQVNKASKILQSYGVSLHTMETEIQATEKFLQNYRTTGYDSAATSAVEIAQELDIDPSFPPSRSGKKRRLFDYQGEQSRSTPTSAPPKVSARAPAHRSYHFRGVKLKSCIKKIHHNLYISKQANVRIKHADTEGASHKKFGTDARVQ